MNPKSKSKTAWLVIIGAGALDILVWHTILFQLISPAKGIYFLDVGQGDAILVVSPENIKILTDAGFNSRVRQNLEKILSPASRYLDLAVISHPQLDHFGGFRELLRSYEFGAFLWNGREAEGEAAAEWQELKTEIQKRGIPLIAVGGGDKIKIGEWQGKIISPDAELVRSGELNDTALVEFWQTPTFNFLLTGDIGAEVEKYLLPKQRQKVDILKVAHHGSKYSSTAEFLNLIQPRLAVISVGRSNRYGHPAPETLKRLRERGATIFRTDENGTVSIIAENNKLRVFLEH